MSIVDIVDMDDNVIGQDDTANKNNLGFISRNVIVFIQDNDGKYVICRRASHVKVDPDLYDASVCGNVDAGEMYEAAAHRELKEELGIRCNLKFLEKFYNEFPHKNITRKHHTAIFYGRSDSPITLSEETSEYVKMSFEELRSAIYHHPQKFCYGFVQEFKQAESKLRERMKTYKILLDGDDVILKTGDAKVAYIRKHLRDSDLKGRTVESIRPEECSRSLLTPIIGPDAYNQMVSYVYSREGTLSILPVHGALRGLAALSSFAELYVATARTVEQAENVAESCRINGNIVKKVYSVVDPEFAEISEVAGSKKVGIALKLEAKLFVDDDTRHMPSEPVEGLQCLLFGEASRKNVPAYIQIARNWDEVVTYAQRLRM